MKSYFQYTMSVAIVAASFAAATQTAIAGEVAYVPLGSDNKLVIVDIKSDKVTGAISGLQAVHGLAKTPDGKFLIAGSYEGREPSAKKIAKPTGVSADEHAAHHAKPPKGAIKPGSEISTLSVVKVADGSIVRRIDVPGAVHHVAVSPNGRFAIVTHPNEDKVSAVELKSYKVVANIATGSLPNYAVFSPDGSQVYVSNAGNNTISAIDVNKWFVRWNAVVGESPEHVVLSKDGNTLYTNNIDDATVSVLDVTKQEVVKTLSIGGSPLHGIDLSDDGGTLFVASLGGNKLVAVDLASGKSRNVMLKPEPYHLKVIRGAGKVYVSSADKPKVWVIDAKSLKAIGEINIGGKGHQIVQSSGS